MGMLSTAAYVLTMDMFGPIADNAGGIVEMSLQVDIAIPEVFIGGLLGSMLLFVFSAWACSAVGRTAQEVVVNEVRRQFVERPGIMEYQEKSDYGRCVAIVAAASLREMIKPGFFFRLLGHFTGQPLLGAKVVASMLMFATVAGILMALFLNTAGGAWDNAK
ncbi:Inorganic H+ pyrophosphatase [Musa troglodytarum]|nr:Inorganic H+ pyrophosphatase [Musa troglodytarum]